MLKSTLALCFILFIACQPEEPQGFLEPARLRDIYLDVLRARTAISDSDSVMAKIGEVLAHHQVPDSLFQASLRYYEGHPEEWLDILDAVIDSLEADKKPRTKSGPKPSPSPFQPPEIK